MRYARDMLCFFKTPGRNCHCLKWSWAIVIQDSLRVLIPFHPLSFQFLIIFRGFFFYFYLVICSILTYSSSIYLFFYMWLGHRGNKSRREAHTLISISTLSSSLYSIRSQEITRPEKMHHLFEIELLVIWSAPVVSSGRQSKCGTWKLHRLTEGYGELKQLKSMNN